MNMQPTLRDEPPQLALHAGGPVAETLLGVTTVLTIGAAIIFVGVMGLLWLAMRRSKSTPADTRLWMVGGGILFPTAVLLALFAYSQWHRPPWRVAPPKDALVVGITGHMWWWEVRYHDPATGREVVTANEVHLPVGRPVYFGLSSADVLHSFWVPALGGKMDMVPGRLQHLQLQAGTAGSWRGQCAEYCGEQHAKMALQVVAKPQAEFDAWLAAQAAPAAPPSNVLAARGRDAFVAQRCVACHTVRGLAEGSEGSEGSRLGPDLTHVGSRMMLGAGTLPNDPRQLADWIAETQAHKPGARMPSSRDMDAPALQAIAAWLSELK